MDSSSDPYHDDDDNDDDIYITSELELLRFDEVDKVVEFYMLCRVLFISGGRR